MHISFHCSSHEGPVWQLAWAHPMFGNLLASCGYDRKVIIWKETNGTWGKLYEYSNHDSSGKLYEKNWLKGQVGKILTKADTEILQQRFGLIC